MKYQELSELGVEELQQRLQELQESYYRQREDVLTGKDSNSASLKHLRADIARVNTALAGRQKKSA